MLEKYDAIFLSVYGLFQKHNERTNAMSVAFNISFPKLEIERDSRNIKVSFLTPKKMNATPATSVIDYWTITDHSGCVVRDESVGENSYILADKYGKGIVLTMKGAGFRLAYDALNVWYLL